MSEPVYNIAVLLACYNRKQQTLAFLESLVAQQVFNKHAIDIYILDDASTDGSAQAIKEKYPFVTIVTGTGNLFWAGSMRTIWEYALAQKRHDLFFLFNDDVRFFTDALERLLGYYEEAGKGSMIIGSTMNPVTKSISYGGIDYKVHWIKNTREELIQPDETKLVSCRFGNANILLVDRLTVQKVGILSAAYTHYFADFDYIHTAYKKGIRVFIAPGYYGYCTDDHGVNWMPPQATLRQRIAYLYHPKGLAIKEHLYFTRKHFPLSYVSVFVKLWMKTLFPVIWERYKKKRTV